MENVVGSWRPARLYTLVDVFESQVELELSQMYTHEDGKAVLVTLYYDLLTGFGHWTSFYRQKTSIQHIAWHLGSGTEELPQFAFWSLERGRFGTSLGKKTIVESQK